MKRNFKLGFLLLLVVIVVIAVIEAGQKERINWTKTYNPEDKIPFGTYVVRQELKDIFPENEDLEEINRSLYSFFTDSTEVRSEGEELIFIGGTFNPGWSAIGELMDFVKSGNTAFLATTYLPDSLTQSLHLSVTQFDAYQVDKQYDEPKPVYELAADTAQVKYDRPAQTYFFNDLDTTATILGNLKYKNRKFPNFVKVRYGQGEFYLQLDPSVYANYYLLKEENYKLAYASLRHLQGTHLLWYDEFYKNGAESTPLRVILSHPALRWAWYILLLALLLYLVFKSRREQGATPIVKPEENQSVAFAETVGSLYYENGSPGDMLKKKIKYFRYAFKKEFHLEELTPEDPEWRRQLSLRLGISEEEITVFFKALHKYDKNIGSTGDLSKVQDLIEGFKQKIKRYE